VIFFADAKTYEPRKAEEHLQHQDEFYKKRAALVHPFTQHILDIVEESGDDPIKITTVANRFARETGHRWKTRDEREDLKKQAFRIIGELIKGFFLERDRRKWLKWVPPDNPRRKAFVQRVDEGLKSLPKPNITF
jgi:hypothetical protein